MSSKCGCCSAENHFIIVNSDQDKDKFPGNTPSDFNVNIQLGTCFHHDNYECALVDFTYHSRGMKDKRNFTPVLITFDGVQHSEVIGVDERILKMTTLKPAKFEIKQFSHPYYVKTRRSTATTFKISIKDADTLQPTSLLRGTTWCTLHFKTI